MCPAVDVTNEHVVDGTAGGDGAANTLHVTGNFTERRLTFDGSRLKAVTGKRVNTPHPPRICAPDACHPCRVLAHVV
jgi:hypothetical protein